MKDQFFERLSENEQINFLNEKVALYNNKNFIETDPIQIPHLFSLKEDVEIAGFLTAIISWGNRKMILKNAHELIEIMGNSPYDYIMSWNIKNSNQLKNFIHRTFNTIDLEYFMKALQNIYAKHNGLESVFSKHVEKNSTQKSISEFKKVFFELDYPQRTLKHISDPLNNSAAKRINMYLRWMVRKDNCGVDLGIWEKIPMSALSCPLDVHSGNVARKLQLLNRIQNDAKAVAELDLNLRKMDNIDPVKYDFALFGLGVFEKF